MRDREGYYIVIKVSILQENIIVLNVYESNRKASDYVKQKLIELQG